MAKEAEDEDEGISKDEKLILKYAEEGKTLSYIGFTSQSFITSIKQYSLDYKTRRNRKGQNTEIPPLRNHYGMIKLRQTCPFRQRIQMTKKTVILGQMSSLR